MVEAEDQMLLYIGGEGGTGKSQIIKALALGFELLKCQSEVLMMAPTGNAAFNIDGQTIHQALNIDIFNQPPHEISSHAYFLCMGKSIIIIDEISMVSQTLLHTINQQCNRIRAVQQGIGNASHSVYLLATFETPLITLCPSVLP